MEKKLFTLEGYRKELLETKEEAIGALSFKRYTANDKQLMANALVFWKYLRTASDEIDTPEDHAEYRRFLAEALEALSADNNYIRIVCMVEMLPNSVWRKLLWRTNIDFMSYESFLRRIQHKQIYELSQAYTDFINGIVPKVRIRRFIDWLKFFFKILTFEDLKNEPFNRYQKSLSKGAWAFSLLNLDFGFSLYPDGEDDDYMITNKSFTRFLSVKNHINDFIVNQEDGIYWAMYRTARSNAGFRPNKRVEIKTHICPGFWLTLGLHLLFWIVSPIGFAIFLDRLIETQAVQYIPMVIMFSPTPLWILTVVLRKIFSSIKTLVQNVADIDLEKNVALKYTLIGVIAATVLTVSTVAYWGVIVGLGLAGIAPFSSFMCLTSVLFLLISLAKNSNEDVIYDITPTWVIILAVVSIGSVVFQLIDQYIAGPVGHFFAWIGMGIYDFAVDQPIMFLWVMLTMFMFVIMARSVIYFTEDEKKFVARQKFTNWVMLVEVVFTLTLPFMQGLLDGASFYELFFDSGAGVLLVIVVAVMMIAVVLNFISNKSNIEIRLMSDTLADFISENIKGLEQKEWNVDKKVFLKNKWLMSLTAEQAELETRNIFNFVRSLPIGYGNMRDAVLLLVPIITSDKIDAFKAGYKKYRQKHSKKSWTDDETMKVLEYFAKGYSVVEAHRLVRRETQKQIDKKKRRAAWGESVTASILWWLTPLIWLVTKIGLLFTKIGQFLKTLADLWELFNKRCPYVSKSKVLD
ncbi:MAG TPA: hypothetical protein PK950_00455 [Candidatus Paceibacterota bacterium]|nr:hypothetical protein [Candidatus Paceibacterota bacterium]